MLLIWAPFALAQLTLPQSSARAKITQLLGLTEVTIDYSRPNVVLKGQDRTDQIWGKQVPWEMTPNQMTGKAFPWRAGANENTVISFSDPVSIEGKPLAAGSYSFHIIPHENGEATLIFNRDDHQWGSFNYDDAQDALRVKITTRSGEPTNLLTYRFPAVDEQSALCELAWEKKVFPFTIEVNTPEVTLQNMRRELAQSKGFVWEGYNAAAKYCLDHDIALDQAMEWIDRGILNFGANFTMLTTKADLLDKMDKTAEANTLREKAMKIGAIREIHAHGFTLVNSGKVEEGFEVLKKNYEKYYALGYEDATDECVVNLGLAMAYAAKKEMTMALKYGNAGIETAPPSLKGVAENFVARMQKPDK